MKRLNLAWPSAMMETAQSAFPAPLDLTNQPPDTFFAKFTQELKCMEDIHWVTLEAQLVAWQPYMTTRIQEVVWRAKFTTIALKSCCGEEKALSTWCEENGVLKLVLFGWSTQAGIHLKESLWNNDETAATGNLLSTICGICTQYFYM